MLQTTEATFSLSSLKLKQIIILLTLRTQQNFLNKILLFLQISPMSISPDDALALTKPCKSTCSSICNNNHQDNYQNNLIRIANK